MDQKKVNCYKCMHFYVTWDKRFPKGCRAYGFKTTTIPSNTVFQSSGHACMKFSEKKNLKR